MVPRPSLAKAAGPTVTRAVKALAAALAGVIFFVTSSAMAAPDLPALVTKARGQGLAREVGWQRLVHYRPGGWRNPVSEIDGADFFLAPTGKTDPAAELEATLNAFALPVVPGHEDAHALCRFPARRRWLDEQLHFEGALHAPTCKALASYEAALDLESVAVVFSGPYLNNPESAFGHTFLRLEKRRAAGATEPNDRLDYGVDFVAIPDTRNFLLYAFKGLTGFFPGIVSFHSFEEKTREYGNHEARDLWEYDLALTPGEVKLLADHLWELRPTHFDYFYVSQNCSYGVLATLEAVAPRIDVVSKLNVVVLPRDTIQAIFTVPGLVRGVRYRPSRRSRFRAQVARLSSVDKDMAERLTVEPNAPLPSDFTLGESIAVLDTAVLVLDARFAWDVGLSRDPTIVAARARLVERRLLLSPSAALPPMPPPPFEKAPERGHASIRLTLGSGMTTQYGNGYGTLGYRLMLHDLVDPPNGEAELSLVQFLDTHVRYDVARRKLTLDTLTFAEVLALNPVTRFEKKLSWRARAFGMRLHDRAAPDAFAHGLDFALGGTLASENEHVAFFLMADAYFAISPSLDGISGSVVRAGVGPYGGLRVRLPGAVVGLLTASCSYLPAQSLRGTYDLRASVRQGLGKNVALGVEAAAQPLSAEAQLSSYLYF